MEKLNELLDIRNSLVSEEEMIELYDVLDAFDSVEQAVESLEREIKSLQE